MATWDFGLFLLERGWILFYQCLDGQPWSTFGAWGVDCGETSVWWCLCHHLSFWALPQVVGRGLPTLAPGLASDLIFYFPYSPAGWWQALVAMCARWKCERWKEPGSPKPLHMPGLLHLHQVVTCVRKTSFISLILECLNISAWQSFGRKSFGM